MAGRITLEITNDSTGAAGNVALCSLNVSLPGGVTKERALAQMLVFFQTHTVAVGTRTAGARWLADGASGSVPMPFPTADYAIVAPGLTPGYGLSRGSDNLPPLGTSVLVQELSTTPGRRSTGRMFLPYFNVLSFTGGGLVNSTTIDTVTEAYDELICDNPSGTPAFNTVPIGPLVRSKFPAGVGTDYLITGATVSQIPATLRSRKR